MKALEGEAEGDCVSWLLEDTSVPTAKLSSMQDISGILSFN